MIHINLLADERLRQKFCLKRNKAVNCRKRIGCERDPMECPLLHASAVQELMITKNASLGHALNMSLRKEIERDRLKEKLEEIK